MPLADATRQQARQARAAIASIALPPQWNTCRANRDRVYCYFTVAILDRFPPLLSVHLAQNLLIWHEILLSGGNARIINKLVHLLYSVITGSWSLAQGLCSAFTFQTMLFEIRFPSQPSMGCCLYLSALSQCWNDSNRTKHYPGT
jgi:hypothetical protein